MRPVPYFTSRSYWVQAVPPTASAGRVTETKIWASLSKSVTFAMLLFAQQPR